MELLKLVQHQVRLGAPLPWNVRDAQGNLLLARGYLLADADQMTALLERGAFVDIEEVKAVRRAEAAAAAAAAASGPPPTIFAMWEAAIWRLDLVLRSASLESGFPQRVDELARHIISLAASTSRCGRTRNALAPTH